MSAPLNQYLFGERFKLLHGLSVDEALTGHSVHPFSREVMGPDDSEEFWGELRPNDQPWKEQVEEIVAGTSDPAAMIKSWARDHTELLVGTQHPAVKARNLRDLTKELRLEGRTPDRPLYRGASIPPEEQIKSRPDEALSFTEDRHVATSFARGGGARGHVYRREPAGLRGLFVPDFVERERTVGRNQRPEREWLIDPTTIKPGE